MLGQQIVLVALLMLSSYSSANPNDDLTIKLDVDINSDNGQHKHQSFELPVGRHINHNTAASKKDNKRQLIVNAIILTEKSKALFFVNSF